MKKPHEEQWAAKGASVVWKDHPVSVQLLGWLHGARQGAEERARLAATAPEMARLLLEILNDRQPASTVHHFDRIEQVRREAGVMENAGNDAHPSFVFDERSPDRSSTLLQSTRRQER